MSAAGEFRLDPGIARLTVPVAALGISDLLLMEDARFPWVLLVPRRAGATELIDFDAAERAALMEEIAAVSTALKAATACDKLNVAAIGNVVAQLHIHVVARFRADAAWPRPVWGFGEAVAYEAERRDKLVATIRTLLPSR
jgi:diadenosine tetraphosphate (Ap4A) HIT family hydrolase